MINTLLVFNPSDCHMECWRAEYLFINNCCFFTSASMIFVFEDLGVQSVAASLMWIISTSCQTPFHVYPSFLMNPGDTTGRLNGMIDQEGHSTSLQNGLFGYTITRGMCPDVLYGKLQISVVSVVSANNWDIFNEALQFEQPEYNSQKSESCSSSSRSSRPFIHSVLINTCLQILGYFLC